MTKNNYPQERGTHSKIRYLFFWANYDSFTTLFLPRFFDISNSVLLFLDIWSIGKFITNLFSESIIEVAPGHYLVGSFFDPVTNRLKVPEN